MCVWKWAFGRPCIVVCISGISEAVCCLAAFSPMTSIQDSPGPEFRARRSPVVSVQLHPDEYSSPSAFGCIPAAIELPQYQGESGRDSASNRLPLQLQTLV